MEKGYVRDVKGSCFSKKIQGNPIACWLLQYDRNATQSSDRVGLVYMIWLKRWTMKEKCTAGVTKTCSNMESFVIKLYVCVLIYIYIFWLVVWNIVYFP